MAVYGPRSTVYVRVPKHALTAASSHRPAGECSRSCGSGRQAQVRQVDVQPTPATLAMSTVLKAGESAFQPLLWTKTAFHALRGAQPLLHALFGVKTLSDTFFAPPLKKPGSLVATVNISP